MPQALPFQTAKQLAAAIRKKKIGCLELLDLYLERVKAYNPAFDVTPAGLITAIVTERGVISPVNEEGIRGMIDCILPGGR